MSDKIGDCVQDVIALAYGSDTHLQKCARAEMRISELLRDADFEGSSRSNLAQDIRDELSRVINLHHGAARQCLHAVVDFLDRQELDRLAS